MKHWTVLRERLALFGYDSYAEYLRSDHWKSVKQRYRRSRLPQGCVVCGLLLVDLHHRSYKSLGKENLNHLIPLCREHHYSTHQHLASHFKSQGKKKTTLWQSHKRIA
jgi:hypothetical protein